MNKIIETWDRNFNNMIEKDKKAKAKGEIVGRYIKEPIADGYAYYEIISEGITKVEIKVVRNIGDDWVVPYWGEVARIDKNYVINGLEMEDNLQKLFKKQ